MLNYNTILLLGVILSLLFFGQTKPVKYKYLLIGLIVSILMGFSNQTYLVDSFYFIFGILTLIYSIFSFIDKKQINLVIGIFVFFSVFIDFFLYSFSDVFQYLILIPVLLSFYYIIKNRNKHSTTISIVILLACYGISELMELF